MMKRIAEIPNGPGARLTGVVYLLYFLTAIFAQYLGQHKLAAFSNATNLVAYALYVALAVLFYYLFKPVNTLISLIAAVISVVGCIIGALALFYAPASQISPLWFFGPYCILIGYLIFRSTFLPRILGVLMVLAGIGWFTFLSPFGKYVTLYIEIVGIVAEALLMLWLIVMGVNVQRWRKQAELDA